MWRILYGNYLAQGGTVRIGDVTLTQAEPREILALRREMLGYVSQFLRVVTRVPTLEVVAEPLRAVGMDSAAAEARARDLDLTGCDTLLTDIALAFERAKTALQKLRVQGG